MSQPTHEVLKPFDPDGSGKLQPGARVDADGWRNTTFLVEQRYLKPLPVIVMSAQPPMKGKEANRGYQPAN